MLRPKPGALGVHGDLEILSQIEIRVNWISLGNWRAFASDSKTLTDRVAIELSMCLLTLGTAIDIIGTPERESQGPQVKNRALFPPPKGCPRSRPPLSKGRDLVSIRALRLGRFIGF